MDTANQAHSGDVIHTLDSLPAPGLLVSADGHIIFKNHASRVLPALNHAGDMLPKILLAAGFGRGVALPLEAHPNAQVFAVQLHAQLVAVIDLEGADDWREALAKLRQNALAEPQILTQDNLTGAGNALGLAHAAAREISRSERVSSPTALLLVELQADPARDDGDLRDLVKCLHTTIRPTDTVFRLDGPCCAVLAPDLAWRQAHQVAERILDGLGHHPFLADSAIRIGVAERLIGENFDDWLNRARTALEQARGAPPDPIAVQAEGASDTWSSNARASALRLVWDDSYRSGIADVDAGHQLLFRKANDVLGMATRKGVNSSRVRQLVDELIEVMDEHFRSEDSLLRQAGYKHQAEYRSEHEQMLLDARQMRDRVRAGSVDVIRLIDLLAVGVINRHMLGATADAHRQLGRWYARELLKPVRAVSESARKRGLRPSDASPIAPRPGADGASPPARR